jgi:hypothetical protein
MTFDPRTNDYILADGRRISKAEILNFRRSDFFVSDAEWKSRTAPKVLPMSLELFEQDCVRLIESIPLDDPLADLDTRKFAENALALVREYQAYRVRTRRLEIEEERLSYDLLALREKGAQHGQAYDYLVRLLQHYAPQCEPLPDLLGLISQIDNLLVGLASRQGG